MALGVDPCGGEGEGGGHGQGWEGVVCGVRQEPSASEGKGEGEGEQTVATVTVTVTELRLRGRGLVGAIPWGQVLRHLPDLRVIDVSSNWLYGAVPGLEDLLQAGRD